MKTSASKNEILKRELEQLFGEQDANIETAAQCLKVCLILPACVFCVPCVRENKQSRNWNTTLELNSRLCHST